MSSRSSANFFVADHLLAAARIRRDHILVLLLLLPPMAGHPALAAGFARFFARPLVRGALLVRRFSTLAGNLALLDTFHRGESTILCCHHNLLTGNMRPSALGFRCAALHSRSAFKHLGCNRYARQTALTI